MSTISITVTRYNPEKGPEPYPQSYAIPYREDMVVLDALNYIKDHMDGSLTFRWSCRMGVCGSCGMMVNGTPKLTCAAFLRDYYPGEIQVGPLENFPVIRDLVIDMDDFMNKLQEIKPWIIRPEEKPVEQGEYLQSPHELNLYRQFSMCINCMICYSACPVYGNDSSFIGPAAIALAHRYDMDSRDEGQDERAEIIGSHQGIWECTFVGECSQVCPKNVDPAAAIQRSKVQLTKDYFFSMIWPWSK
ncbi:succinate dehydrogenase/fumarate reductase iron-sulfur subunit [Acidobacteria bacterium AH-259-D05]|nr:succinate dehydrogenase/fumarate reductase iron-sulfur subunit [Acidobacteria bacterium AH-259-D05]